MPRPHLGFEEEPHPAALDHSVLSRHPLLAGVAGTVVAVLMASLSIGTLYQGRQGVLDHARETSANFVAIMSNDVARNVEIYNLSLNAIVEGAQNPAIMELSPALHRLILFDRATSAAYISGAYVLDAYGKVTAAGKDAPPSGGLFHQPRIFLRPATQSLGQPVFLASVCVAFAQHPDDRHEPARQRAERFVRRHRAAGNEPRLFQLAAGQAQRGRRGVDLYHLSGRHDDRPQAFPREHRPQGRRLVHVPAHGE